MSLVLLDALVELWLKLMRATPALTALQAALFPIAVALVRVAKGGEEREEERVREKREEKREEEGG